MCFYRNFEKVYNFAYMKKTRSITMTTAGVLCAILLLSVDLLQGTQNADQQIIWMLRLPRITTAILTGAALALAGVQMQSILRNPLADPHIMGISSGAAAGAAIVTMTGGVSALGGLAAGLSIAGAAFIGAMAAGLAIITVSRRFLTSTTLLIFGVMLGFIVSAFTTILQYSSDAESLKLFYSWSAGSFSVTTWPQIAILAGALIIGGVISFRGRKGLDIIMFGDEYAELAGAKANHIRQSALLSSCILTGAATAFCGPLGFVGIIAPHIARAAFRTSSHRIILPASLLTGGIIGLTSDLLSQLFPTPLPVASTMAMVGIPIILYILIKKPDYGE